jgi:5'-nucleotidase / UDP-sugar diphosphatase
LIKTIKELTGPVTFFITLLLFIPAASGTDRHQPLTITIAHINDTHSHLEATDENVLINGVRTTVSLGGFTRLKTALDELRKREKNVLLLHAGDAVQGTLYFTRFKGDADFAFLNLIGVDAMTFGNHEFDRGPELIPRFIAKAAFPILSANIDFSDNPGLAAKIQPYLIKDFGGEGVAIIGVTTADTAFISSPGPTIRFRDIESSVRKAVQDLTAQGVNKIVLLSHIGYDADRRLAERVADIDVIVGGHSHTLLGDEAMLKRFGMAAEGPYPTIVKNREGKTVLVLQAWRWAEVLGAAKIEFDEKGEIVSYAGDPKFIVGDEFAQYKAVVPKGNVYDGIVQSIHASGVARVYAEDAKAKAMLIPYTRQLETLKKTVIAIATNDLIIGLNSGPGPLVADGMIWKTGARIAFQNRGGIRTDIHEGPLTLGKVLETLPFGNTLVLMDLTGRDIRNALEDMVDFQMTTLQTDSPVKLRLPYVAGIAYRVTTTSLRGARITDITLKDAKGDHVFMDPDQTYRVVTNSYLANGGDGCVTFKNASGYKYDTGFMDADVMTDYLKLLKTISNPREERIKAYRQWSCRGAGIHHDGGGLRKAEGFGFPFPRDAPAFVGHGNEMLRQAVALISKKQSGPSRAGMRNDACPDITAHHPERFPEYGQDHGKIHIGRYS